MTRPLASVQDDFQRYVLEGDDAIVGDVAGPDDDYRRARLAVYFNAYRLRLSEALANDFEGLKHYLGEERFSALARDYIAATPSVYRNVRWYGGAMAGFLRADARYAAEPVLAELAAFEWTLGLAFDAPDATPVDVGALGRVPPEAWADLHFKLHPCLYTLSLEWNTAEIWQAAADRRPAPAPLRAASTVAVWRREFVARYRAMPDAENAALARARAGASFGALCEALERSHGEQAALRAAQLLQGWITEGWVAGFSAGTPG